MKLKVLRKGPFHNISQAYPIYNDNSDWSLFARLDSSVIRRLYRTAIAEFKSLSEIEEFENAWSIDLEQSSQQIEFLPLVISSNGTGENEGRDVVYVSYNGGSLNLSGDGQDGNSKYGKCF